MFLKTFDSTVKTRSKGQRKKMGIVAIISGGLFGSLTALIALIGFGAEWTEAVYAYLLSGTVFSAAMLCSMLAGQKAAAPGDPFAA